MKGMLCIMLAGAAALAMAEEPLLGNGNFTVPLSKAVPAANGTVDTGRSWIFYLNSGATGTVSVNAGVLQVAPDNIATQPYGIQLIQSPVTYEQGADYEFSFDARSTTERIITVKLGGVEARQWAAYSGEQKVTIGKDWKRYTVTFTMGKPTDTAGRAEFWFTQGPETVWLRNVALVKTSQAAVAAAPVSGTKTKADEDAITKWEPVWSDEFNGSAIDSSKWGYERGSLYNGWGNNELEYYTDLPANSSIQKVDGTSSLVITARKEPTSDNGRTFDYTSARMLTRGKFTMLSGKLEVRAKLPKGQGLWPAIWLLGANIDSTPWPACGEVDLMELLGHEPNIIHSTVHGPVSGGPGLGQAYTLPAGQTFADSFHVFTFEWRPDHLEFLVDGKLFYVVPRAKLDYEQGPREWVYDHPFYILLNVAVGGGWPGNPDKTTVFPQTMAVDYVRVFKNVGQELGPGEMKWNP
jgi:beta-glucanase (GH16 family)